MFSHLSSFVKERKQNFRALTVFLLLFLMPFVGFPGSSVGKESCSAGEPGSITELGRTVGEGTGCPVQYSWASLVTKLVKNPPASWETRV